MSSAMHAVTQKTRTEEIKVQAGKSHNKLKEEEMKESKRRQWPWLRRTCYSVVGSHWFEGMCGAIILFNMMVVVFETDASVDGGEPAFYIGVLTNCLLSIYTTELVMKLYVFRWQFFHEMWNNLDFTIIGIDLVFLAISLVVDKMPSISILRVFRLVRLARAFKAAKSFHELNSLLRACTCALKAIFWGMVMLSLTLTVWGILAVQLIHPINQDIVRKKPWLYADCDRCPRAFGTVFDSIVTFWKQLVAGDSWGTLCEPIIEEQTWTFFFFVMVLVTISLTMLNCILAVVVEAGAAAAAADEHDKAIQREKMVMKAEGKLIDLCQGLDSDASGSLNIDEFLNGYRNNSAFRECLEVMHVTESDMFMIFNICDEDDSGDVDYMEFVDQLRRIKHSGQEMLLHYVTDIRHMVNTIHRHMAQDPTVKTTPRGENATGAGANPTSPVLEASAQNGETVQRAGTGFETRVVASIERVPGALLRAELGGAVDPLDSIQMRVEQLERSSLAAEEALRNAENIKLQSKEPGFPYNEKMEHIYRINADLVAIMGDVALQSKVQTGLLNKLVSSGGRAPMSSTDHPETSIQPTWSLPRPMSHPATILGQSPSPGLPNGMDAADFAHFDNSGITSVQAPSGPGCCVRIV